MANHVALIREAARLMRERAEKATPGPWVADISEIYSQFQGGLWVGETLRIDDGAQTEPNSSYVASWHPGVALLVADLLEGAAHREEEYLASTGPCTCGLGVCICIEPEPGDESALALAVARAYLGRADG